MVQLSLLRIRNEETDTTPPPIGVFGLVAKCDGKKKINARGSSVRHIA